MLYRTLLQESQQSALKWQGNRKKERKKERKVWLKSQNEKVPQKIDSEGDFRLRGQIR